MVRFRILVCLAGRTNPDLRGYAASGLPGHRPLERLGEGAIEVGDEGFDASLQVFFGSEAGAAQEFAREDGEPILWWVAPSRGMTLTSAGLLYAATQRRMSSTLPMIRGLKQAVSMRETARSELGKRIRQRRRSRALSCSARIPRWARRVSRRNWRADLRAFSLTLGIFRAKQGFWPGRKAPRQALEPRSDFLKRRLNGRRRYFDNVECFTVSASAK